VSRTGIAIGAAVAAGLGAIAGTVLVGLRVREETVVARPYEDGLRHDAENRARAAWGIEVKLPGGPPETGARPLAFELLGREGRPADAAAVAVEISRPDTSREARSVAARAEGGGRWSADLTFPAPGPWDVRFDVVRGEDRVRLERRVLVHAACDLGEGPCTRPLEGGGEVTLEITPRPLRTMRELAVRVEVQGPPHPGEGEVSVSFLMPGMEMGENRAALAPAGGGRWEGTAVLVSCPSGRRGWAVEVGVAPRTGPARAARFALTVAEGRP